MAWTIVECGFEDINETINFGTRTLAEGDALYETTTLATVTTDEEVSKNPSIQCLNYCKKVYLLIDNTFRLFDNNCSNVELFTSFADDINCFAVSQDSKIVVICLQDGSIHSLYIPGGGKLICSTMLPDIPNSNYEKMFSTAAFLEITDNDKVHFIISTSFKKSYRFTLNNIGSIYNELNTDANDLDVHFTFEEVSNTIREQNVTEFGYESLCIQLAKESKKVFADSAPWTVALTEEGCIIGINQLSELIMELYMEEMIHDFVYLDGFDKRLLVLTVPVAGSSYIKLLSFPDFKQIYQMRVSDHVYLIAPGTDQDEIMFIDGLTHHTAFVQELRIKVITESHSENRLSRLLNRKQFVEAGKFASLLGLSLQPVYKARAEEYLVKLSVKLDDVHNLIKVLDNVSDVKFVVMCCLESSPDSLAGIEVAVGYAFGRIVEALKNNPDDSTLLESKSIILHTLKKLSIFRMLQFEFDNLDGAQIMEKWMHFSNADLVEEMQYYFKNGQIDRCMVIFTSLDQYSKSKLNSEKIKNILRTTPVQQPIMSLLPWVRHLLGYSIQLSSELLPTIIDWLYDRVRQCERNEPSNWPENARDFLKRVIDFARSTFTNTNLLQKQNVITDTSFNKVRDLIVALDEMAILAKQFRIKMALNEYTQDSKTVVNNLLNKISLNLLSEFMNNFFYKYVRDRKMNPDKILIEYIENVLICGNSLEEEIVVSFLKFIHSNSVRLEAILIILKNANVPWSSVITNLADESMKGSHSYIEKFQMQKKNIAIKLLLKKYAVQGVASYTNTEILFLVKRILFVSNPDMLKDIEIVASRNPALREECSVQTFNHFIHKGAIDEALTFLNGLEKSLLIRCSMSILHITQTFIVGDKRCNEIILHYLEMLQSCALKLENQIMEHEFVTFNKEVQRLKNLHILKVTHNCDISVTDFNAEDYFPGLIEKVILLVGKDEYNWSQACAKCASIAQLVGLKKEAAIFELVKRARNMKCLIAAAEFLLETESDVRSLCSLAVKSFTFLSQIDEINLSSNSSTLMHHSTVLDTSADMDLQVMSLLNLVDRLCVRAAMNSDAVQLPAVSLLLRWSTVCHWFRMDVGDTCSEWRHALHYTPDSMWPPASRTVAAVLRVFIQFLSFTAGKLILPNSSCFQDAEVHEGISQEEYLEYLNQLSSIIHILQSEGHDLIAYHLINTLRSSMNLICIDPEFVGHVKQTLQTLLLTRVVPQLLAKVVACRKADQLLALSLFATSGFQPFKWIRPALKMYRKDARRLWTVATLGCRYLEVQNNIGEAHNAYTILRLRCEWWRRWLSRCNVPYNDTFQLNPDEILVNHLLKSSNCSLKLLEEFCTDFSLDIQVFLPQLLRNYLLQWKADFQPPQSVGFNASLVVKNSEDVLIKDCTEIIMAMENKKAVVDQLNTAWNEVSYYQYEVYLCILELLEKLDPTCTNSNHKLLLLFLKNYTRINKPRHLELQAYQSVRPASRSLDTLATYRLPFLPALQHVVADVWRVLRDEVDLHTYQSWLEAATMLGLQQDDICTYAVKSVIHSGVLSNPDVTTGANGAPWQIHARHTALLKSIQKCVSYIENSEVGTAVLYQAVWESTPGADQAALADMCWRKAREWRRALHEHGPQSTAEEARLQAVCEKVKRKYLECTTMHMLYTNDLGQDKYLDLIGHCDQLIRALYYDDRIVDSTTCATVQCPDINGVVDGLGELHSLNVMNIRMELLTECLQETREVSNALDDSFTSYDTHRRKHHQSENVYKKNNDNLKRIIYICRSADQEMWKTALWSVTESGQDETMQTFTGATPNFSTRVRALQCLLAVAEPAELEALTHQPYDDFRSYVECLQMLNNLDSVGVMVTPEELDECDKNELVRKVLQSRADPKLSPLLAAQVALRRSIWTTNIWEKILTAFLKQSMIDELQDCLPKLHDSLYGSSLDSIIISAWETVIESRFTKFTEQMAMNIAGFLVIQVCPVISKLNDCLLKMFHKCFNAKLFEFCAMFLPYIQQEDSRLLIVKDLEPCRSEHLYKKIEDLTIYGIFNTNRAISILKSYGSSN